MKPYCLGKLFQSLITINVAGILQAFLYPQDHITLSPFVLLTTVSLLFILILKKAVAFPGIIGYNGRKSLR